MAQVASLAICAGFSAVIVPNAADKREHKQKRGQNGASL